MAIPRDLRELAEALVAEAHQEKVLPQVITGLREVSEALALNQALAPQLQEPGVPEADRQKMMRHALKGEIHEYALNALLILQRMNGLKHMSAFLDEVLARARNAAGYYVAEVASATPLEPGQKTELRTTLSKKFDGQVDIYETIDQSLIGGLIVQVGDWRFDASVKGSIERLKSALSA